MGRLQPPPGNGRRRRAGAGGPGYVTRALSGPTPARHGHQSSAAGDPGPSRRRRFGSICAVRTCGALPADLAASSESLLRVALASHRPRRGVGLRVRPGDSEGPPRPLALPIPGHSTRVCWPAGPNGCHAPSHRAGGRRPAEAWSCGEAFWAGRPALFI